ncbi:Dot/Icm T4SS effector AnkD/LegA15 [Legionella lytica]|uniref:Dot/Icm T4SS effector AnkD/LegA15 n=1 Tax=Legionella lytica TaxID=96232 RepID=A0ABW8D7B8_9GAMM
MPLNPLDVIDMLSKLYPQQESDTKKQQKMAEQQEILNRTKIENDNFFAQLNRLFLERLSEARLKTELDEAAKQAGFDNLQHALNSAQNKYGQSPLQQAFQQQDFNKAHQLMDYGAEVGPIERAAFNVALDSEAATSAGFQRPSAKDDNALHPVKNFGLTLGVEMMSKDGTFSQLAEIGPTYNMISESVAKYAEREPKFKEISEAFDFSNKTAGFSSSTPRNSPQAGEKMADRISQGKITTIPVSCEGHAMGLSVVPDGPGSKSGYMVFTNRGTGAEGNPGTQIYRIDDLSKVDSKFINSMMNGHAQGQSHGAIMKQIHDVAGNKPPIHQISQQGQKCDNCTIANPRSNVHGILLCQKALEKGGFDKLDAQDHQNAKTDYKKFSNGMRADKVDELVAAIAKNPKDEDLSNMAKEYLKKTAHKDGDEVNRIRDKLEGALSRTADSRAQHDQNYEPPMSAPR